MSPTSPPATSRPRTRIALRPFGISELSGAGSFVTAAGAVLAAPGEDLDAVIVLGVGEPHRERLDDLVRDDIPHLVVRFFDDEVLIGPLVVPAETACLRCIDAHHLEHQADWPLTVARLASEDRRRPVHPSPIGLTAVALGWAVWDLVTLRTGGRPATWSTEITLPAATADLEAVTWLRHPDCGCSWNPRLSPRSAE